MMLGDQRTDRSDNPHAVGAGKFEDVMFREHDPSLPKLKHTTNAQKNPRTGHTIAQDGFNR
jgi:hypothetical protein